MWAIGKQESCSKVQVNYGRLSFPRVVGSHQSHDGFPSEAPKVRFESA